ncbi:MAG: hypothetical protein U1A07_23560 [Phenylobacterium sp.]|jgi:hypothetical protein|nr:hypothetical protein [Phenylobacterium sp.]MDZ4321772.1 hypothetical protein [Phenylobacterium sp.]
MTDALTERQLEAVELILAAAAQSPAMADEATREALDFARPLLETAPALSAFVERLTQQIARTGGRSRRRLTAHRAALKLAPGARSSCQTR